MAAPQNKVIVTCAVTGGIHTPTMSPYLPITAEDCLEVATPDETRDMLQLKGKHAVAF